MLERHRNRGGLGEKVIIRSLLAKLERSARVIELGAGVIYAGNI